MVSLIAVTNRPAAERIQAQLRQQGIPADLQQEGPSPLLPASPAARLPIHIMVAETDLARAREILQERLEGA